jgi:two-component sensor histidine kinase
MASSRITTLAASMEHIAVDSGALAPVSDVVRLMRQFVEMLEGICDATSLAEVMDIAARTAALGCAAPMSKVVELDAPSDSLIIRGHHGFKRDMRGVSAGVAEEGNPPAEALRRAAPVVDTDVRRRGEALPQVLREHGVVTSVNVPLINHDGPYGILEVDYCEVVGVGPLQLSFLASVAAALAGQIQQMRFQDALATERDAKAVLLREQQHRIRNNFQLIIAMVQSSARKAKEEASRKSLGDIQRRVFAMALLYDHLLGLSEQAQHADLGRYLSAMAVSFDDFYDLRGQFLSLKIDLEFGIVVGLDTCTTVGTIVNELVANAVEHAFGGSQGQIIVSLKRAPGGPCVISVQDDGEGMTPDMMERSQGLRMVKSMAAAIAGRIELRESPGQGTTWLLTLPSLA